MIDFKEVIKGKDYDFLRTDENLKDRLILMGLGGSYAYGTFKNDGTSDIDIRGVAAELPKNLIGFGEFEQYTETNTDTVIYGFNKMVKLLISNNPNTIEILGCRPDHYLYVSKTGEELLKNSYRFLSKRCIDSFVGYAMGQLARLENALVCGDVPQLMKEEHIANSLKTAMAGFKSRYSDMGTNKFNIYVDKSPRVDFECELFADVHFNHYSLRDFTNILNELLNIIRMYGKVNKRGRKKSDEGLDKHAMHLIRLYLMALDILEGRGIVTYREKDRDELLLIRYGKFRKADGTYGDDFFDLLESYKVKLAYAVKHTELPNEPDFEWIEDFVMRTNKTIITGGVF